MEQKYLIDTNAVIAYLTETLSNNQLDNIDFLLDKNLIYISVINKIELLCFKNLSEDEENVINEFIRDVEIIEINNDIIEKTIEIRKKHNLKIPDAIISSSSVLNNLILITRNEKDFKRISEIKILNPFL